MKIINLGVGRQSTALYYMSSMGELPKCDYAIFADTGGEKLNTHKYYDYLIKWQKQNNGIPIHKAFYKNLKSDILNKRRMNLPAFTDTKGKVGMLRRSCTPDYKTAQVNMKIRTLLKLGNKHFPVIEQWFGISMDERERMTIPQQKSRINVYPFCGYKIFNNGRCEKLDNPTMTLNDILKWFNDHNLPIPQKSACTFCPFHSDDHWLRMKQNSPEDFADAVLIDQSIRDSSVRGVKNPVFLHHSLKPLEQVNFNENQTTIWGNCTDACDN